MRFWQVLALVSVAACQRSPAPRAAVGSGAHHAQARSARTPHRSEPEPGQPFSGPMAKRLRQLSNEIAKKRGWPLLDPVPVERASDEQVRQLIEMETRSQLPEPVTQATDRLLVLLGVVPADFEGMDAAAQALSPSLGGLYLTSEHRIVVSDRLREPELDVALEHELVHAYQDQLFHVAKRVRYVDDGGDRVAAIHALAEGEATSINLDNALSTAGRTSLDLDPATVARTIVAAAPAPNVPALIWRSVLAAYLDGLRCVVALRRAGGWPAVDAVWKRGLNGTDELLHPERLNWRAWGGRTADSATKPALARGTESAGDRAPVPIDAPPVPELALRYHDVFGEQSLRLILEQVQPYEAAASNASVWRADRIALFQGATGQALVWHLRSGDEAGAARLAGSLSQALGLGEPDQLAQLRCRTRSDHPALAVGYRGRHVVVVAGAWNLTEERDPGSSGGACSRLEHWAQAALGD